MVILIIMNRNRITHHGELRLSLCSKDEEYLGKRGRQHLRLAVAAASVVAHWQPRLGASRLPVRRLGDSFLLADGGQLAEGDDIG
jgi:hypothetical protein